MVGTILRIFTYWYCRHLLTMSRNKIPHLRIGLTFTDTLPSRKLIPMSSRHVRCHRPELYAHVFDSGPHTVCLRGTLSHTQSTLESREEYVHEAVRRTDTWLVNRSVSINISSYDWLCDVIVIDLHAVKPADTIESLTLAESRLGHLEHRHRHRKNSKLRHRIIVKWTANFPLALEYLRRACVST